MKIGIFSDTYFPQISGVSTSIKTLRDELIRLGNTVYIFTTTDPNSDEIQDQAENIIRLRSVPFVSMEERRIVMVGLPTALSIASKYKLDIVHTQTEFGVGILGKVVANRLKIPVIHTLHTKYEDYLHYIANGKLIHPSAVKYVIRTFLLGTEGIICPSEMTEQAIIDYGVKIPLRVIATGIELKKFTRPDISKVDSEKLREELGIQTGETMLLSLCRLSQEKNIQAVLRALPEIQQNTKVKLIIVGDGPYRHDLEAIVNEKQLENIVKFVGPIPNEEVVFYYKAADFFISASTSETQGLTFTESIASGTPVIAWENSYLKRIVNNDMFGYLFENEHKIASTTLKAIKQNVPFDSATFDRKLYEISSENFGRKVADFYDWMITNYIPPMEHMTNSMLLFGIGTVGNMKIVRNQVTDVISDQTKKIYETGHSLISKVSKASKYVKIKANKSSDSLNQSHSLNDEETDLNKED